jgi:CubicO group peptidase (beta-lactamase class C family)
LFPTALLPLKASLPAVNRYIEAEMKLNHIPGAAVAIWRRGDVIYAKGFGVRSIASQERMTPHTPVDLASVSKITYRGRGAAIESRGQNRY